MENELLIMSEDFKNRMTVKNNKISKYTKILFMIYGLTRRGLECEDTAFFEEVRSILSELFEEEYDI